MKLLEKASPLFQILRLKKVLVWQKIIARLGVMSEHKEREREIKIRAHSNCKKYLYPSICG